MKSSPAIPGGAATTRSHGVRCLRMISTVIRALGALDSGRADPSIDETGGIAQREKLPTSIENLAYAGASGSRSATKPAQRSSEIARSLFATCSRRRTRPTAIPRQSCKKQSVRTLIHLWRESSRRAPQCAGFRCRFPSPTRLRDSPASCGGVLTGVLLLSESELHLTKLPPTACVALR